MRDFSDALSKPICISIAKLVGHSMGGSVVVRACPMLLEHRYKVTGIAVLDVVEGEFQYSILVNSS